MDKISAIIVDDEKNNSDLMAHFLQSYCPYVNCVAICNTKEDAIEQINLAQPQLLFLDIVLDEGTSFDILEALNYESYKVIFVTAFDDYAIKAFKYSAIDYILKPLEIEQLITAVNKAYKEIDKSQYTEQIQIQETYKSITNNSLPRSLIAIPSSKKIDFIKIENIISLKSEGRYTIFNLTDNRQIVATKNIGEYEGILDASIFFRVHHSHIVNLTHVDNISKEDGTYCVMSNKETVPIAKRRQEQLNKFLKIK